MLRPSIPRSTRPAGHKRSYCAAWARSGHTTPPAAIPPGCRIRQQRTYIRRQWTGLRLGRPAPGHKSAPKGNRSYWAPRPPPAQCARHWPCSWQYGALAPARPAPRRSPYSPPIEYKPGCTTQRARHPPAHRQSCRFPAAPAHRAGSAWNGARKRAETKAQYRWE